MGFSLLKELKKMQMSTLNSFKDICNGKKMGFLGLLKIKYKVRKAGLQFIESVEKKFGCLS
jgi:hypothetical protein